MFEVNISLEVDIGCCIQFMDVVDIGVVVGQNGCWGVGNIVSSCEVLNGCRIKLDVVSLRDVSVEFEVCVVIVGRIENEVSMLLDVVVGLCYVVVV